MKPVKSKPPWDQFCTCYPVYTGVRLIQVKLITISYNEILFKVRCRQVELQMYCTSVALIRSWIYTCTITSFWTRKTLMKMKNNLFNKVSNITSFWSSNKHFPIMSVTIWWRTLSLWGYMTKFYLNLDRLKKKCKRSYALLGNIFFWYIAV